MDSELTYSLSTASVASSSLSMPQSASYEATGTVNMVVVDTDVPMTDKVLTGKAKGWKNLKPAKKGEIRNPKGIKGPYVKDAIIRKTSKREMANKIADKLISTATGCVPSESTKAIEVILKTEGAFTDSPVVAVQQNNISITPESIKLMEEFLRSKGINI